jgi:CheY-like chemotaxis protein
LPHPQARADRYHERVHKILIVEDDDDFREAARETLESEGYWVACARNGQEALEMARAEAEPCLVLLDLLMPVMSGWQFRALQMQDPFLARFPVLVMTATSSLEEAAVHADGILPKPIRVESLLDAVARWCTPADFAAAPTRRELGGVISLPMVEGESGPHS